MAFPEYQDQALVVLTLRNTFQDAHLPERRVLLSENVPVAIIGRTSKRNADLKEYPNNLYFDCPVISRTHATLKLDVDQREIILRDTDSMHGTFVNNMRLGKTESRHIKTGDKITFGAPVDRVTEKYYPTEVEAKVIFGAAARPPRFPVTYKVPDESDIEDLCSDGGNEDTADTRSILRKNSFRSAFSTVAIDLTGDEAPDQEPSHKQPSPAAGPSPESNQADVPQACYVNVASLFEAEEAMPESNSHADSDELSVFSPEMTHHDAETSIEEDDFGSAFDSDCSQSPDFSSCDLSDFEPHNDEISPVNSISSSASCMSDMEDNSNDASAMEDQESHTSDLGDIESKVSGLGHNESNVPKLGENENRVCNLGIGSLEFENQESAAHEKVTRLHRLQPLDFDERTRAQPISISPKLLSFNLCSEQSPQDSTSRILFTSHSSHLLAESLGTKTGKSEYFSAREKNKRNVHQKSCNASANESNSQYSLGFANFPFDFTSRPIPPQAELLRTSGLQCLNSPIEEGNKPAHSEDSVLDETSANSFEISKAAEGHPGAAKRTNMRIEDIVDPLVELSEENQNLKSQSKRKADSISQLTPEEQSAEDHLQEHSLPEEASIQSLGAPLELVSLDFRAALSTHVDTRRQPKRLRRAAEVFGYAALGGIAVMSALIATAPSL